MNAELKNVEVVEVTSPLATIEALVLGINPTLDPEQVLALYDRILFFAGELKRLKKLADAGVLEWVRENGELRISDTEYYRIVEQKDTECTDIPAALEACLDFYNGDFAKMTEVLCSEPIKHGQCRTILPPETYAKLFKTTTKQDLDTGKNKKVLARLNEKFLR